MAHIPSTDKHSQSLSRRKLKALKRRAQSLLYDIAYYWDDGPVSADIDRLLENIDAGIAAIEESMTTQMEVNAESELL